MSISPAAAPRPSLDQMLAEMRNCAQHLERGQADAPLTHQVEQLLRPQASGTMTVIVAAWGAELAARAAAWVTGSDAPALAAEGVTEIPAAANSRLAIFDLEAGRAQAATVLKRALSEASLLLVVLEQGAAPPPAARETLELLASGCCGHLQAVFQKTPAVIAPLPLPGTLVARLPVTPDTLPPSHLFDSRSAGLRTALAASARLRGALTVHDLLSDREQSELRLLQSRQKRDQRLERAAPAGEGDGRRVLETLKLWLNDEFAALAQEIRERGRRAGLRTGEMAGFTEQLIESLNPQDIEQEEAGRKLRLQLKEQVEDELKERFAENFRALMAGDIAAIAAAFRRIRDRIEQTLADSAAPLPSQVLQPPPLHQLCGPIEESFHIDVRYRGEVPRRGFLQRLGEGRRVLFVFLMAGSLVGGFLGFNVRRIAVLGPVFLLLFLAVVGYTFYSWKGEDRDNMDAELAKVRDILKMDFSRLLQDALRERQARLQAVLEDSRRESLQALDATLRETAAGAVAELESERKAARARLKTLETRLKEIQLLAQATARRRPLLERSLAEAGAALNPAWAAAAGSAP